MPPQNHISIMCEFELVYVYRTDCTYCLVTRINSCNGPIGGALKAFYNTLWNRVDKKEDKKNSATTKQCRNVLQITLNIRSLLYIPPAPPKRITKECTVSILKHQQDIYTNLFLQSIAHTHLN